MNSLQAGETPLICAAREGHTETVAALLAHPHIDPNAFTVVNSCFIRNFMH